MVSTTSRIVELKVRSPEESNLVHSDLSFIKATRSLRILIVATEAPPVQGGIARTVGDLWEGFREHGHSVDVLAYPKVGRLEFGEVRLSSLIFKLLQLLSHINKYDVIHIHGSTPTISDVTLLFTRLFRKRPLVIYTHHMDLDFRPIGILNRMYNSLHHRLIALADVVIVSTQDSLKPLGYKRRRIVIPFGINLNHFSTSGQKDPEFTVLFVGQFRPYKGVRVLLQAMRQVKGAHLIIVGKGPEEQAYRSLGRELGLDVEFHIGVDDNQLRQLYQRAHVVVLPSVSRLEAFGIVLVEGMAAGCIPIASNLPGVREVVGKTGFLFPVGDVDRLAEVLHELRDSPAQVQQCSERARIRAAEFDREHAICEYERLITGLIACRNLNNRFIDRACSYTAALHAFATDVAHYLAADWAEMSLRLTQDEFYLVVSTGSTRVLPQQQFLQASSCRIDNSMLIEPGDEPVPLRNAGVRAQPAAMITPLTVDGEYFGSLMLTRERPFNKHDLNDLTYLVHHTAPSLHAAVKHAAMEAMG